MSTFGKQWMGIVVLVSLAAAPPARAALPAARTMDYFFRADPSDPLSDVLLVAHLDLKAVDTNGMTVAWEISEAVFDELDAQGNVSASWSVASPSVGTSDGVWWVYHADPADPRIPEFDEVPLLAGTASPYDPTEAKLDYSFESASCGPGCGLMYGGKVTSATYSFARVGAQQPIAEDEDEPAEIGGGGGNPT